MSVLKAYSDLPQDVDLLSKDLVDCFFQVHKNLGPGFLEVNYQDALVFELQCKGLAFEREKTFQVPYKDVVLNSEFRFDLVIEDQIIVELKAVEKIHPVHQAQIYAYLNAANLHLGFLVNFNVPLIKNGIHRYTNKNLRNFDASRKKD